MSEEKTIITTHLGNALQSLTKSFAEDSLFLITDEDVSRACLPQFLAEVPVASSNILVLPTGESHKTLETVVVIWKFLVERGATRRSVVLNLGGGVVSDLGAFAASTFKRGMSYINIPTTLLSAVDASTGGKSGFNFEGLKNEIGVFKPALGVVIYMNFFKSLDFSNLLSGYAEMIKHALISDTYLLDQSLHFDLEQIDWRRLQALIEQNLSVKQRLVDEDPYEKGPRKALNFGHTFGHAFETLSYRKQEPLRHGYAVMWGMVCALYLSYMKLKFPKERVIELLYYAKEHYGSFPFSCTDYDMLLDLIRHDKKNEPNRINFSLLADVGDVRVNQSASREEILETLDFVREN